nr:hypothetical protein [Microbacterium halimionae]
MIATTVVVSISLAGCGTPGTGATEASADSIAERVSVLGISPELVYTTDVEGYDLAPQSVAQAGENGISATWFNNSTGAMVTIRTESGDLTAASCASTPMWDGPDEPVTCTNDEDVWRRVSSGIHEYVAQRTNALIWVNGSGDVPPADLLKAANAAHVPSNAELETLFSDMPTTTAEPVQRGDIPEHGDGAPIDPSAPGG